MVVLNDLGRCVDLGLGEPQEGVNGTTMFGPMELHSDEHITWKWKKWPYKKAVFHFHVRDVRMRMCTISSHPVQRDIPGCECTWSVPGVQRDVPQLLGSPRGLPSLHTASPHRRQARGRGAAARCGAGAWARRWGGRWGWRKNQVRMNRKESGALDVWVGRKTIQTPTSSEPTGLRRPFSGSGRVHRGPNLLHIGRDSLGDVDAADADDCSPRCP